MNRKMRARVASSLPLRPTGSIEEDDFFEDIDLNHEEMLLDDYCPCCDWEAYRPDFREKDPYDYLLWVEEVRPCVKYPNNPLAQLADELASEA